MTGTFTSTIHIYPTLVQPGVGRLVRGVKLPGCLGCFESATEHGSYMPLIFDRLLHWQRRQQREERVRVSSRRASKEPDLYLHLLPAFMEPFGPVSSSDRAAIAKLPVGSHPPGLLYGVCRTCALLNDEGNLTRLTAANRRRHFILSHWPMWCAHVCPGLETWLGMVEFTPRLFWAFEMDNIISPDNREFTVQVPFLSSIRWSSRWNSRGMMPPWKTALAHPHNRTVLMSFSGSLQGSTEGAAIRRLLARACTAANDPRVCTAIVADKKAFQNGDVGDDQVVPHELAHLSAAARQMRAVLQLKQRSIFCLEPFGMARVRKGIIDALLCGCIPIIFNTHTEFERLWPLHFASWGSGASIRIEPQALLSGHIALIPLLRSVHTSAGWADGPAWGRPSHAVRQMQAAIARHAHRLVYSLDNEYEGDAADLVIRAMHRIVTSRAYCTKVMPTSWRCKDGNESQGTAGL